MTLDQIRALAKQAGYQLVPIEPTIKMMPASAIAAEWKEYYKAKSNARSSKMSHIDVMKQVHAAIFAMKYRKALELLEAAIAQDEATTPTDAELLVKGWAIGHYTATCGRCSKMHDFTDKRSSVCRDCASDLVAKDKAQLRSLRVN